MRLHALLAPSAIALILSAPAAQAAEAATGAAAEATAGAPPASARPPAFENASLPRLTIDLPLHASITGGALLAELGLVLLEDQLVPGACRWCEPPQLDRWARQQLRWSDTEAAASASNVTMLAVPAGAALALGLGAFDGPRGRREALEDLVVLTEAVSVTMLATQVAKYTAARERPYAWASGGSVAPDGRESFWSGHTSFTFSVAAAYTQVARLRGRPGWRWQSALLFAGAAATGWLRLAGDRHWLTDVGVGAVTGTAVGLVVPLLAFREEGAKAPAVALVPAPGGFGLVF